jgi:hypothetical protein
MCNPIHGCSNVSSSYMFASERDDAPDRGVESSSAISSAPGGADPITEVAILLAQSFREDRKQARSLSDAAEAARFREVEQQIEQIREKADSLFMEGLIKGGAQIGGGALSSIGGAEALEISEPVKAQATMTRWSGLGDIGEGMGTAIGSGYARDAANGQAAADEHASRAAAHQAASEKYRDEAEEASRMNGKVLELLQNLNETRSATEGAAASIRG